MILNLDKQKLLNSLIENLNEQELIWINGYFNGLVSKNINNTISAECESLIKELQIIFITETGNAKTLASDISAQLKSLKIKSIIKSANQTNFSQLSNGGHFLFIISTHGEGEVPAAGKKIMDFLNKEKPNLSKLNYSIIALGDLTYPLFCEAGKILNRQLKKLEAKQFLELQTSDIDISNVVSNWLNEFKKIAISESAISTNTNITNSQKISKSTYEGVILNNILLNDNGSNKAVYHLEISSDANYEPGDSLRYIPKNNLENVKNIANILKIDLEKKIDYNNSQVSIENLLINNLEIERLKKINIEKYISLSNINEKYISENVDLVYLLKNYPPKNNLTIENLIEILNPIEARFYSISSSPSTHTNEIHLTISEHYFKNKEQNKIGKASNLLTKLKQNETINFSIHKNNLFRLPQENKDIIMIGPGTGIAPFRSFLFERDSTNASGKNWLFFGDQHFQTDFLYQSELQNLITNGVLTKLNTAFSRDQKQKIYVQDRIKENGRDIINWIENGATLYVCGIKDPMSKDVENTLIELFKNHKKISKQDSIKILEDMKEDGRYNLDVY